MELREFLEKRERELMQEISDLRCQLAPKEAELAEVRQAKATLGMATPAAIGSLSGGLGALTAKAVVEATSIADSSLVTSVSPEDEPSSPYAKLTIKELVRKVLAEHFRNGATTRQMLDFFRDAWDLNIDRTSLSPQLSRLFQDRIIGRRDNHVWFLLDLDFISEDELLTFEGWMKYQAINPSTITPDELSMWRDYFDEAVRRSKTGPKVGLMKLQRVPGEEKYAVAIRDGSDLWLTMWVRCSRKGEIFIMYPRGDRDSDPHASYHLDGTLHQKSYGAKGLSQKLQPLTAAFRGIEHLGTYYGHGKSSGAVCYPKAFDGVVAVEPGILGPAQGSVSIDLVEPGYEPKADPDAPQRQLFPRGDRPSVLITIRKNNQDVAFLNWPDDFIKSMCSGPVVTASPPKNCKF